MDARTRNIIVIIYNHEMIYVDKSVSNIVSVMVGYEPSFITRQTLSLKLDQHGFYCFISPTGKVYEIYKYENPKYKPQKRKRNKIDPNSASL